MSSAAFIDALGEATAAGEGVLRALLRRRPLPTAFDELVDGLLATIDDVVARQLDAIYEVPALRALESHWRGLALVVERIDGTPNSKCEFLNVSREDLLADFEDAPDTPKSGLDRLTYSAEYGPFGGRPYAAVFTTYTFEDRPEDLKLLAFAGQVCARTCLPFVAGAGPSLSADSATWGALRARPEARFLALLEGELLLRPPYSRTGAFPYMQRDDLSSWGAASALLAITMARSFARYRLPLHAFGRLDGTVQKLPSHRGRSSRSSIDPTSSVDPASRGRERGTIPVVQLGEGQVMLAGDATAALPVASALPGVAPADLELNARLSAVLLAGRIIHYFKVAQREQIGTWNEGSIIVEQLQSWLRAQPPPSLFSDFEVSRRDEPSWHAITLMLCTSTGAGTIVIHNHLDKE